MITLAIDTSAHLCAAALHDDAGDRLLSQCSEDIGRGHAERLMDVVAAVLDEARLGYRDLDRIAVGIGPGSFTGVRVGIAAARGMALGLGIVALGVGALDALHASARRDGNPEGTVLALLDARRGEVYAQFFASRAPGYPTAPFVADCAQVAALLGDDSNIALCGSGADAVAAALGRDVPVVHRLAAAPVADYARLGAAVAGGSRPEPLYVRAPDARPQTGFALARA
ncbi:MAG: tRNA (adenosine(37)-N6)-threonylcarbamoyltransferase complex dimerization subunit type 1 TsaB [Pseudomonadota bacterium]|nr:tRNA (adenosine(37)-N6)-threonylcarbamoyltransferase complex dimerization subunit type 1 TsaB [Pseudomonadota bacterium]